MSAESDLDLGEQRKMGTKRQNCHYDASHVTNTCLILLSNPKGVCFNLLSLCTSFSFLQGEIILCNILRLL